MSPDPFFGSRTSTPKPNSSTIAGAEELLRRKSIPPSVSGHLCVVHDYDAARQTVDVVLKADPDSHVIHGVPIADSDGTVMHFVRAYKTLVQKASDPNIEPTIGLVMFTYDDSNGQLNTRGRREPYTRRKLTMHSPLFIATFNAGDTPPVHPTLWDAEEDGTDTDFIGPDDEAIVFGNGNAIISKANGDLAFRMGGNTIIFGLDQAAGINTKKAMRTGFDLSDRVSLGD